MRNAFCSVRKGTNLLLVLVFFCLHIFVKGEGVDGSIHSQ